MEDHEKLREDLMKDNAEFHTYSAINQRAKKIVVKAVPKMNKEKLKKKLNQEFQN